MRSSTTVQKSQSYSHSYSPSVPLSVYREVTTELQAAKAMLNSLHTQNQQLVKQNQQLRQEIEKVVQSVLHAQQIADATTKVNSLKNTFTAVEEVEVDSYRRRSQLESVSHGSGWGLAIAILVIVVTAFSGGYLLVRPLIAK